MFKMLKQETEEKSWDGMLLNRFISRRVYINVVIVLHTCIQYDFASKIMESVFGGLQVYIVWIIANDRKRNYDVLFICCEMCLSGDKEGD